MLGGVAILGLMVLAVVSVGGRYVVNQPLRGYVDWIEQLMPLIAFLGIAYTARDGGHIRMDIFITRLKGRTLWAFEGLTTIAMLVLVLLLIWGSWAHFERSFDFAAPLWSRDSSMDIALPLWPAKLLVPLAFSVLALRLWIQIWGYARAFWKGAKSPVAVPLTLDIAEVAAAEARLLDAKPTIPRGTAHD